MRLVKRQYAIIKYVGCGLLAFTGVKLSKSKAAVCVHHGLQVNPANTFQPADIESVLANQLAGIIAVNMALCKLRVGLLQQADLLFGQFKTLGHDLFFKTQQALVFGLYVFFDPHIADTGGADRKAFKCQLIRDAQLPKSGMFKRKLDNPAPDLFRQLVRMRSRNRRFVHQAFETMLLKGSFIFVKLAARDFVHPASLGYVAQFFS